MLDRYLRMYYDAGTKGVNNKGAFDSNLVLLI